MCCPTNPHSFLWVIYGDSKDIKNQHILCFPNVGATRAVLFLPVGTWKTWWAVLAGLDVNERGAKLPAEQEEVPMCICFDFHWEPRKKYFDLILQFSFSLAQCERSASDQKCSCLICIGSHSVIRHNWRYKNKKNNHHIEEWSASFLIFFFFLAIPVLFLKENGFMSSWSVYSGREEGSLWCLF